MQSSIFLPDEDGERLAQFAEFVNSHEGDFYLGDEHLEFQLSPAVLAALRSVLAVMQRGQAVAISANNLQMGKIEAAELLGTSLVGLKTLLEEKQLSYTGHLDSPHINLSAALEFLAAKHQKQREALTELTEESSALGLYN
jgi:hypothetical protein